MIEEGIILIDRSKPLWEIRIVGDRFYEAQRKSRMSQKSEPRKLKADWIKDINAALAADIKGLDKCTIDTLTDLYNAIVKE